MKREREIRIKKMLWYVVKQWRIIILCTFVFVVLLGGIQYKKDYMNAQNVVVEKEPTIWEAKRALSDTEMREVGIAINYTNTMQSTRNYNENSILMKIPYDKEMVSRLQFCIEDMEGNKVLEAGQYNSAYENYVVSGALGSDIVKELDMQISSQYMSELLTIVQDAENDNSDEQDKAIITIQVIHYDETELEKIDNAIIKLMQQHATDIAKLIGEHQLSLQQMSTSSVTDYDLFYTQQERTSDYDTASGKYLEWLGKMNSNQMIVYENWDELMSSEEPDPIEEEKQSVDMANPNPALPALNVHKMLLGAVLGCFMSIIVFMIIYLGTKKLRDASDYENLKVKVLGEVNVDNSNRLFKSIDKKINTLEYYSERNILLEQKISVIATEIDIACQKKNVDGIFISSSTQTDKVRDIIQKLKEQLENKKINVTDGQTVAYNAGGLEQACKAGYIVLVEEEQKSDFSNVVEEVIICKNNDINILGGILIRA